MMDISKVGTTHMFPTRVITYTWDDVETLNKELKEMLFERAEKIPGITYSNVGGYHSSIDLLSWNYPCIAPFINMVQSMSQIMARNDGLSDGNKIDLSLTAWGNIIQNGNYHMVHRHPNNFWSGVYYIDGGDPDKTVELNGQFEFVDPRTGAHMLTHKSLGYPRYQIKPKPGLMIMFPAWLDHFVHPYIGKSKRVTIAFNVRVV